MLFNAQNGSVSIDGVNMNYIKFGRGNENIIMLPGLGDGLRTVKGMALPLAFLYRKYVKDYSIYVFSRKDTLPVEYSTCDMADDVKAAMDELGIEKTHVIGVSQGGMIAQYLALNFPECINKLVLVVTLARPNETIQGVIGKWIEYAGNNDYKSIFIDTAEKSYTEGYLTKYRQFYPVLCNMKKPKGYERFITMAHACINHNSYDELEQITCPTLILGGECDRIVGTGTSEEIAERISGSQIHMYEGLGHGLYDEAKDFNKRIIDFLVGK